MLVKAGIEADSPSHARSILSQLFGIGNVISVTQRMAEETAKVPSPEEQRIKATTAQAKRLSLRAKQLQADNKLRKAQVKLSKSTDIE
jgi:hypothetical protein